MQGVSEQMQIALKGSHLSIQQHRLWTMQEANQVYLVQGALALEGPLDYVAFRQALQLVIERHEILHTVFRCLPGVDVPVQVLIEKDVHYTEGDLTKLSSSEQEIEIASLFAQMRLEVYDLANGPLHHLHLVRLDGEKNLLLICLPALCVDTVSLTHIAVELGTLYHACLQGRPLEDEPLQYADIAAWQSDLLQEEEAEENQATWRKQDFSLVSSQYLLPDESVLHKAHTAQKTFSPDQQKVAIDESLHKQLQATARSYDVSLETVLLTCWQVLLHRLTEKEHGIVGVACDGRDYEDLAELPGLYTRFVPLQALLLEDQPFTTTLREVEQALQDIRKRQHYFTWDLSTRHDEEHVTFFPTTFSFNSWLATPLPADLRISCYAQEGYIERFILHLNALELDNQLRLEIQYDPLYLSDEYSQRLATMLLTLLQNVVRQPEQIAGKLDILDEKQRQWLLTEFTRTQEDYPQHQLLHQLFAAQAVLSPQATALVCEQESITYEQLNRQANRLAHYLRKQGVTANVLVGICLDRSLEMIISLLAVLKAGGAYVPLDSNNPSARLAHQLANSQADNGTTLLLTRQNQLERIPLSGEKVICLDRDAELFADESVDNLAVETALDDIAYVIYTSGSTGMPKGVQIRHRSVLNYTCFMRKQIAPQSGLHFATVSTLAADLGNTVIFCSLVSGGCLHILNYETVTSGDYFARYLHKHTIDVLKIVPSHLRALLTAHDLEVQRSLLPRRYLILGGEAFSEEFARELRTLEPSCTVYNHYGPTETTIGVLLNNLGKLEAFESNVDGARKDDTHTTIPLGRPMANTEVYVLDSYYQIVPVGVAGELCIGGAGLSTGYRRQPEQTRERFIPHPFSRQAQARLYRTGDRACYTADGKILFIGRMDTQVKIRGYRVELQEIEMLLEQHDDVRECVVLLRKDVPQKEQLVAYVVAKPRTGLSHEDVRDFLRQRLPEYMLPSAIVFLHALPLTINGKVDRRALPEPEHAHDGDQTPFVEARTAVEKDLVQIWQAVLQVKRLGIYANFFSLGGHSLLATQLISRIRAKFEIDFPILSFFNAPTVAELAQLLEPMLQNQSLDTLPVLRPASREEDIPLSFSQQRLWFLDQLEPGSSAYTIPVAVHLEGPLNRVAFEKSLHEIVKRHEILRTTFQNHDGRPVQMIDPANTLHITYEDLGGSSDEGQAHTTLRLAVEEAQRPFDLAHGPLMRVTLLRLNAEKHVLLLTMHHIITDGWSNGIFIHELSTLYTAFVQDRPSPLTDLSLQYADFALWQQQWLQGEVLEHQVSYWQRQLADVPYLQLPTDHARPPVQTFHGAQQTITLPHHIHQGLQALSQQKGVTLFMTLLSAFQVLLYRYCGQVDIAVGTDIANRNHSEIEGLIGFFVNQLVMRADLSGNPSFLEFLMLTRQTALDAYAHQDVPFEKLVEVLNPERDLSRSPLFQVAFALQNRPEYEQLLDVTLRPLETRQTIAKFDLTLGVIETPTSLQTLIEYNTNLFEAETISRLLTHWQCLLESIVNDPASRLDELALLTPEEREQLLVEWNATDVNYPLDRSFHDLFAEQTLRTPEAMALICDEATLSYQQLDMLSNQLAHALISLGVEPGVHVGVYMERSLEMAVSMLALFKVGGVYIPLDPAYPVERLTFMFADAGIQIILTQPALFDTLPTTPASVLCLDATWQTLSTCSSEAPTRQYNPLERAYIIYTSGSTGQPKGVMVHHAGMLNHLYAKIADLELSDTDSVTQTASHCFDISIWQFLAALLVGGRVHIVPQKIAGDPTNLFAYVLQERVTILEVVPSLLGAVIHDLGRQERFAELSCLRYLVVTGEALPADLCRYWLKHYPAIPLVNAYGPTECSDDVTHAFIAEAPGADDVNVPIGKAISNTQLYILDEHLAPVPIGVAGQLYVGGNGVGPGYLNLPVLTATTFIPDPFGTHKAGGRLYKTGDLARYLPDGQIEFLGRVDFQVKIRGFRIELDEIEAVLRGYPEVHHCVVLAREDRTGDKRLVAYIAPTLTDTHALNTLRHYTQEKLPEYMVPAAFIMLDALPLTPNGKVDRRALPAPDLLERSSESFVAARNPLEEIVASLWIEVLGHGPISIHDNFFELGGHSLLATQVLSRLRSVLKVELPLRSLFEAPTVEMLAARISVQKQQEEGTLLRPPLVAVSRSEQMPLSFAQQRLWFLEQLEPGNSSYNMPIAIQMRGAVRIEWLAESLRQVMQRHESLRTHFEEQEGRSWQVIEPEKRMPISIIDVHGEAEEARAAVVRQLVREEALRPFDLRRGPLLRAMLIQIGYEESVLILTMHHIISDGWSLGVLVKEITEIYGSLQQQREVKLPVLAVQYPDFATWQRGWLEGAQLEQQLHYWRNYLGHNPLPLKLPADRPRPAIQTEHGAHEALTLPHSLIDGLKQLSQREGVTLFMTLLAAFQTLLYRYTEQEDILIGTPIANRNQGEIEGLIGFFVNMLVMYTNLSGNPTFLELLARVREVALEAYAHQDLPFEKLVEALQPERDLSRSPLFQVVLALQNAPMADNHMGDISIAPFEHETGTAKYDIALFMTDTMQGMLCVAEYNTDLFDRSTIVRLLGHWQRLLEAVVNDPTDHIAELPLLRFEERRQLLQVWNATEAVYPDTLCIHELFESQAREHPNALALTFQGTDITYKELDQRANRVAHYLRARGIGPDMLVGLCIERSVEMLVGLLGILKAGGAYVPLDPAYPTERIAFMLADARVTLLLTQQHLQENFSESGILTVLLDTDIEQSDSENLAATKPDTGVQAGNYAYVIYTSGSTGKPKGTIISHRSVINFFQSMCREPGFTAQDVILAVTSLSFDIAVLELILPLTIGAHAVIVSREVAANGIELAELLVSSEATIMQATPTTWRMLLSTGWEGNPRLKILCGGEALPVELATQLPTRGAGLWNMYGPTETTIWSSVSKIEAQTHRATIGKAIDNTQLYIVDKKLSPVPIGVVGNLYIGGDGLAPGYLYHPDLSADKFIPDPFSQRPGARMYNTGDLARWLADGTVECLGRQDQQVKIRGYRIELGEIESVLERFPLVQEAAVIAREDQPGDKRLAAYIVAGTSVSANKHAQSSAEWDTQQVTNWATVWDQIYVEADTVDDPEFNLAGWNSSYTGLPIPEREMRSWLDHTIQRIISLQPQHVLEIGCGTGMILFRVAPHCLAYTGTDVSAEALRSIQRQISTSEQALTNVTLQQCAADNFSGLQEQQYDTIILNSVIQYFSSIEYLFSVIEQAMQVVKPGGTIFIGDVRNFALLRAFHTSVQLTQADAGLTVEKLQRRIEDQISQDQELVLEPDFFRALPQRISQIGAVEVLMKRSEYENELTMFRYDVVLHIAPTSFVPVEQTYLDWQVQPLDLDDIRHLLQERTSEVMCISNVPDSRVLYPLASVKVLSTEQAELTVADSRQALNASIHKKALVQLEDFYRLAQEYSYGVAAYWSLDGRAGCYDLVFQAENEHTEQRQQPVLRQINADTQTGTGTQYSNNPMLARFLRKPALFLRPYMQEKLPEYMLPAAFVLLDALPLTPNGKVDRRALPAPDQQERPSELFVAARTPLEEILANLWAEVLGHGPISIYDNFFELGGHSLLATQVLSRLRALSGVELPLRSLFEAPTVASLATRMSEQKQQEEGVLLRPSLVPVARSEQMPLSFAQERMWFLEQLEPGNSSYNMPIAVQMRGAVRVEWLEESLRQIVQRHESLRTHFEEHDGRPWQVIEPEKQISVSTIDVCGETEEARAATVRRFVQEEAQRPFDLRKGPLLRVTLIQVEQAEFVLVLTMHHIISDGWSLGVLVKEITQIYAGLQQQREVKLPALAIQYPDFATWQRGWLEGEQLELQLLYWRKQLQGASAIELPTDHPRPLRQSSRGANYAFTLPAELQTALYALCRREGVTLFMTLLATFQTLLYRYTEREDIVVGTDIANRTTAETEALIGFFINLLVLRTDMSGKPTFKELLQRVRETVLEAYTYQDVPFEHIVDSLRLERTLKRTPLVNVLFVLQNVPMSGGELPGVEITPYKIEETTSKFDVAFFLMEEAGVLRGSVNYSTDLFDERTIQRMVNHYEMLLHSAIADLDSSIQTLEMYTSEEKAHKAQAEKKLLQLNRLGLKQTKGEEIALGELFRNAPDKTN